MIDTRNQFYPDYAVSPGQVLLIEMECRKMQPNDLSAKSGIDSKIIRDIITGRSAITPTVASRLSSVLGMPARYWLNLETDYQENLARIAFRNQKENTQLAIVAAVIIAAFMLAGYVELL